MILNKVSIITPTYNHEKYIAQCIISVINQSFINWEMIIVNDGSTDNTENEILKIAATEPRIKYYKQANKGLYKLAETYNFALAQSDGEFVAILEGDDYWYSHYLQTQIPVFDDKTIDFAWCRADVVNYKNEVLRQYPRSYNNHIFNIPNSSVIQTLLDSFPVPVSWIFRKSKLTFIGGFLQNSMLPTVDLPTILALSRNSIFHYNNTNLVAYRRQIEQATRKYTVEISMGMKSVVLAHVNNLTEDEKKSIGLSFKKIESILNNKLTMSYSIYGRSCLVRKEYNQAINSFVKSITNPSDLLLSWRIKSILGVAMAWLKLDLEWMAKLLGKNTYK